MAVNCKKIRERVTKMNTAWAQSAPTVAFKGITQTAFQAKIQAAAAVDQQYADLLAQAKMKADERDRLYQNLSDDSVNIRDGVEGHEDFGPDHSIYETMGFTRVSQRKSGLTRKKKQPATPKS
ncbi:MAG TPA: hypothetical protein VK582_00390 [Pyrinomonadaceae bacterium]|nr:hypothetical protein [Pyrinomonadaceae bacterium]